MSDSNAGLGMVPCKAGCCCIECALDRSYKLSTRFIKKNADSIVRAEKAEAELQLFRSVAKDALWHLRSWLDLHECECEGGHICGRNQVEQTVKALVTLGARRGEKMTCPHAGPFNYCPECVVTPCPLGIRELEKSDVLPT